MALSAVENLRQQARKATQEDIDKLCDNILELFFISERSADCIGLLRHLFFILQASDEEPCISRKLLGAMLSAVSAVGDKSNAKQCLLCQQIVSELLPGDSSSDAHLTPSEEGQMKKEHLSFNLLQGRKFGCIDKSLPVAVRWLSTKGFDFDCQKKAFSFLVAVAMLHTESLTQQSVEICNEQMSKWLMSASLQQAPNPYTINPFRKDESSVVTEVDGTPSRNFFTVLNIGKYYTQDQFLNIYSFSMLYKWLYYSHQGLTGGATDRHQCQSDNPFQSTTIMRVFTALVVRSIDYCFRVFDQCERKSKVLSDAELQVACLSESVTVLDLVCRIDSGQVPKIYQEVKRLYARISQDSHLSCIVLQTIQFFLNHSAAVVHDPGEAYQLFFRDTLSRHFIEPGFAFDTVRFLCDNLATLCYKTNIMSTFFPNLLKILAWHPRTFLSDFVEILPAIMSPGTSMEVFHTLLDLPCMTAALEVMEKVKKIENPNIVTSYSTTDSDPTNSTDAYQNPLFRPLFSFVTRAEGGQGDTINRLSRLHQTLHDMKSCPRVVVCAQAVPILIRVWFSVILEEADDKFATQLLPVVLERSYLLYNIQEFKTDIKRFLSENMVLLLKKYPGIVTSQYNEITDFLMGTRNITDRQQFFASLVWAVGEFCSIQFEASCTADLIGKYYETLEAIIYELSGILTSEADGASISPMVLSVLISAISKLATRCQDLIPRAILCLTKVAKQHFINSVDPDGGESLVSRAKELINLLKLPNFASVVLNPPGEVDSGRWHRDNTSLPIILRGMHQLLCPDSK